MSSKERISTEQTQHAPPQPQSSTALSDTTRDNLFCDCGAHRTPTADGTWRCTQGCGTTVTTDDETFVLVDAQTKVSHDRIQDVSMLLFENPIATCTECNSSMVFHEVRQIRAADEPGTIFYSCRDCGHSWRDD